MTRLKWSKERVLQCIQGRLEQSLPLSTVYRDDTRLFAAAVRYWGSWTAVLKAAGLPHHNRGVARAWSAEQVIDAIRSRHRAGKTLRAVWREDSGLYSSAKRHFGRWTAAVRAAGLESQLPRRRTREELLAAIRRRQADGLPLSGGEHGFPQLFGAARKLFGSWHKAKLAAGIPSTTRNRWTRKRITAAILAYHRRGQLSHVWKDDKPLFSAAVRYFGNWQPALAAAGLTPRVYHRWTEQMVLDELLSWHGRSQQELRTRYPGLAGAAVRFFGNLRAAAEAAGIELKQRSWTRPEIVGAIQDFYVQGAPIHIGGCGHVWLALAAKRHFGSWRNAVTAAGLGGKLPQPKPTRQWTGQAVIEAITSSRARGVWKVWAEDTGLYSAAKKHFGSWRGALLAAGLRPTRRQWTKDIIVREIQDYHSQAVPVGRISRQDPRLTTAAVRLFGTWRAALLAAGLRPTCGPRAPRNRLQPISKGHEECHAKPSSDGLSSAKRRKAG